MKLYEIDEKINNLLDMQATEDMSETDIKDTLDSLLMDRHDKCVNIALYLKDLKNDVEKFKEEEARLNKRRKSLENKLSWLKEYLVHALNGEKIDDDPRVFVYYNKSKRLVIDEDSYIPDEYFIPQEPKLNKEGLKKAIENEEKIDGVFIQDNIYVVVK